VLMNGKVLRFDEVKGYGFIAPSEPGEDVFMHANDLVDEKHLYRDGSDVEFFVEWGEKGPKASQIRLRTQPSPNRLTSLPVPKENVATEPRRGPAALDSPDAAQFGRDVTEALVESVDTLTAAQIRQVRSCVLELVRNAGWVKP
jgi:CspA family cold shock protein